MRSRQKQNKHRFNSIMKTSCFQALQPHRARIKASALPYSTNNQLYGYLVNDHASYKTEFHCKHRSLTIPGAVYPKLPNTNPAIGNGWLSPVMFICAAPKLAILAFNSWSSKMLLEVMLWWTIGLLHPWCKWQSPWATPMAMAFLCGQLSGGSPSSASAASGQGCHSPRTCERASSRLLDEV